jgi:hypothetical protein
MARVTATFARSRNPRGAGERAGVVIVRALERHVEGWLLDGEIRQLSRRSLTEGRVLFRRFLWFLHRQEFETVGKPELRAYLAYSRPLRLKTAQTHFVNLKCFFRWLVAVSPMGELPPPVVRDDQIHPFTEDCSRPPAGPAAASAKTRSCSRCWLIGAVLLSPIYAAWGPVPMAPAGARPPPGEPSGRGPFDARPLRLRAAPAAGGPDRRRGFERGGGVQQKVATPEAPNEKAPPASLIPQMP